MWVTVAFHAGDPEEQIQFDHDTAHAMEILEDYFTGVPWFDAAPRMMHFKNSN